MVIPCGVQFAMDSRLVLFSLESDAQTIVNPVNNGVLSCSEVGLIIKDISLKLESLSNVSIAFVPRKSNMVAHCLAKLSLSLEADMLWLGDYPHCLKTLQFGLLLYQPRYGRIHAIAIPTKADANSKFKNLDFCQLPRCHGRSFYCSSKNL
ncbi:hypothetical protein Ddye_007611 [Dipteronia dyeriana]|uniref:RNase H type-1 domain-containing protein n=1 Tax=Dipteronia dyeriana TaxID=168575 RepID=A0AAE0CSB6_9ROSI|nr:hypothetical protein Ddye_007611 [Dipteronia dyeriana]